MLAAYIFCPEDGGSRIIRGTADELSVSHPRNQQPSMRRNFDTNITGDCEHLNYFEHAQ
jgi:hypothetical protein